MRIHLSIKRSSYRYRQVYVFDVSIGLCSCYSKPVSQHAGGTWLWINFVRRVDRTRHGSRTCPVKSPWIIPLFPPPLSLDYFTKNIPFNETRSYLYLRLNEETAEERDLTIELFDSFFFNRGRDIAIYRRKLQQGENPVNWRALDSRFREISYKLLEKAESERQRSGRKQACTSTSGLCCFLRPGRYILKKIIKDFSLGELGLYSCGEVRTGGEELGL